MMIFNKESSLEKKIIIWFFVISSFEVVTEIFFNKSFQYFLKPAVTILFLSLYWVSSTQKKPLFFVTILFYLIARMFVIPDVMSMLYIGIIVLVINRLLVIYYIIKIIKLQDYIPPIIATVPFIFIFFYLFSLISFENESSYYVLLLQVVLMSIICGIALSHYIMTNGTKDTWLFIYALLTVAMYFILFIEKFYLIDLSPNSFRPLVLILNTMVLFSFYKFVIKNERLNDN